MRLKYLSWKEKQKVKRATLKNRARIKRERTKWAKEAVSWEHEHPKR